METTIVTSDPRIRWGTPCLRDTGISVGQVVALRRAGFTEDRILEVLPLLTADDLDAATEWYDRFGDDALGPRPPTPGEDHIRIAVDRQVQGGQPVIRGTRVTVDAICGLHESGYTIGEILDEYPGLTSDDIAQALSYGDAAGVS